MALAKTDQSFTGIRGHIGGQYYRHGRQRLIIQKMNRHVKKTSPAQARQQNLFMRASNIYKSHLWTQHETNLWLDFARRHPITTKKGANIILGVRSWFIRINITFLYANQPPTFTPPE